MTSPRPRPGTFSKEAEITTSPDLAPTSPRLCSSQKQDDLAPAKRPRPGSEEIESSTLLNHAGFDFAPEAPLKGVGDSRVDGVQVERLGMTREFAGELLRLAEHAPSRAIADQLRRLANEEAA